MFLLFDLSANGKPRNWKAHFTDSFSWPRMIHLAWLLYDKKGNLVEEKDVIIKPKGFDIGPDALKMHKLSLEEIEEKGVDMVDALEAFKPALEQAIYAFAFNLQYNENILQAEYYRNNLVHKFSQTERFCLMRESTFYCKIPNRGGGYKWPSLQQLHAKLFNAGFDGAGNALQDVTALSRCFNKLLSLGELDDLF
ncbi:MAG: hypothetical protein KTR24_01240 [Saprospiraceae bacterium]|nr:hypothetical protein [Saprospiraceae bacterium]